LKIYMSVGVATDQKQTNKAFLYLNRLLWALMQNILFKKNTVLNTEHEFTVFAGWCWKLSNENKISTNKYSCLSFLPLNLKEQFSQLSNVYFLVLNHINNNKDNRSVADNWRNFKLLGKTNHLSTSFHNNCVYCNKGYLWGLSNIQIRSTRKQSDLWSIWELYVDETKIIRYPSRSNSKSDDEEPSFSCWFVAFVFQWLKRSLFCGDKKPWWRNKFETKISFGQEWFRVFCKREQLCPMSSANTFNLFILS